MSDFIPHAMLVTGGAGFIGANFIRHVLTHEPEISIINLDKLTYSGSLDNLDNLPNPKQHHFIQGDIGDEHLVKHILHHHHIDTIVHFAAESHVDRSITSPQTFIETNISGTFTLLEAARQHWFRVDEFLSSHCRFHHISTDEVYGSLQVNAPPFTENTCFRPRSPYAASKAASDHLVNAYYHTYGLPITISHCSNNYGPYQHTEKFIPTIILACIKHQRIPIYGEGKNIRDWLHVSDHCQGIMQIIKKGIVGENYNLGAQNEWENIRLASHICELMDKLNPKENSYTTLLEFVKDRPGHDFRYAIDSNKIKTELNWSPTIDFTTGLLATIQFYLENYSKHSVLI